MSCRVSCCPILRGNCIHHSCLFGDCTNDAVTKDDRYLYEQVKANYRRQNPMLRFFLHIPALWPCWVAAACMSCCCENGGLANYDVSKLDQQQRFDECVCFNMVMSFTMNLDPNYKHPALHGHCSPVAVASPVINIINSNSNNNEVKTGDVNLSNIGNSSNNTQASNAGTSSSNAAGNTGNNLGGSGSTNYSAGDIKKMRVEKAIREERFSDAERILNS